MEHSFRARFCFYKRSLYILNHLEVYLFKYSEFNNRSKEAIDICHKYLDKVFNCAD